MFSASDHSCCGKFAADWMYEEQEYRTQHTAYLGSHSVRHITGIFLHLQQTPQRTLETGAHGIHGLCNYGHSGAFEVWIDLSVKDN